jgi:hypothetical protein
MFREESPGRAAVEGYLLAPDEGIGTYLICRPTSVGAAEVLGIEHDATVAHEAPRKARYRCVFRVDESRGSRLGLGVVAAQVRANFALLAFPCGIDDPEVLYCAAV